MRKIAIYGKGGIGKSTVASNLAATWAQNGLQVMLIGCDPKADSTYLLLGRRTKTLLDQYEQIMEIINSGDSSITLQGIIEEGFAGVKCVEIGGPAPGVGCAGRGISLILDLLDKVGAFSTADCVIFDILGDVVCGGFTTPMRLGFADEVYIVTSGEYSSLYAANNICKGINNISAQLGGFIANCRALPNEIELVTELSLAVGSHLVGSVPRSKLFPRSELLRKTVIEANPQSTEAKVIHKLGDSILNNDQFCIPNHLPTDKLDYLSIASLELIGPDSL